MRILCVHQKYYFLYPTPIKAKKKKQIIPTPINRNPLKYNKWKKKWWDFWLNWKMFVRMNRINRISNKNRKIRYNWSDSCIEIHYMSQFYVFLGVKQKIIENSICCCFWHSNYTCLSTRTFSNWRNSWNSNCSILSFEF